MIKSGLTLLIIVIVFYNLFGNQLSQTVNGAEDTGQNSSKTEIVFRDYKDFVAQLYGSSKSGALGSPIDVIKSASTQLLFYKNELDYWKTVVKRNNPRKSTPLVFNGTFKLNKYHPVVSEAGGKLFFCSFNDYGKTGGEDIFISNKQNDSWSFPAVEDIFSTDNNEAPNWVSADLKKFVLVKFKKKNPRGDLVFVNLSSGNSDPVLYPPPINTNYFEADGRLFNDSIMIFSSDRPNGIGKFREKGTAFKGDLWGNTDIYISVKKDSVWQGVINLGHSINTEMAERTPYLTPDGKYLFFSSTGHIGFGGFDVFVSTRLSESSWTEWSEPVNLGYYVNSPLDDWGFMVIGDGRTAYFSNSKEIYTCTLPDDFYNFDRQFSLQGKVKNEMGRYIAADISITNINDNSNVQILSDAVKGDYFINLDPFADYKLVASAPGYNPVEQTFSFSIDTVSVLRRDLTLISQSQVRIDTSDGLITVFFEFNKYNLDKSFHPKLDYVANLLQTQSEKSQVTIEIGGYTDAIGSDKYNTKLSLKRAQTVFSELIKRGLEDDFFDVKAYGESDPIAPNNTNEGRAKNRRVVLRIKNSL